MQWTCGCGSGGSIPVSSILLAEVSLGKTLNTKLPARRCTVWNDAVTCSEWSSRLEKPNNILRIMQYTVLWAWTCWCDSVRHLFLLQSSAHHHQSGRRPQHPTLDRRREPACLWVRRMDTGHRALHDINQVTHETQKPQRKTFCFMTLENYRPLLASSEWFFHVQQPSAWWCCLGEPLNYYSGSPFNCHLIFTRKRCTVHISVCEQGSNYPVHPQASRQTHRRSQTPPWCQRCGCATSQRSGGWLGPRRWALTQPESPQCYEANPWCTCRRCKVNVSFCWFISRSGHVYQIWWRQWPCCLCPLQLHFCAPCNRGFGRFSDSVI